ncbi:hypothetical protein DPMN_175703 [Dreissena polymorpha]|uniref:Uncharacterized protein n=1 Tax=Dreissena polymorpha TaxID=45954 RepID=A0A9D4E5N1_DREPO|nr:hypothetical protein DPMN_175703 [Dreissena polymorpha]
MSLKTAPHVLYGAQDQEVCTEHDCWSTRAPTGDHQMTKVRLALTRHQAQLPVQDCSPGHARGRSTSRPSEEKLDG